MYNMKRPISHTNNSLHDLGLDNFLFALCSWKLTVKLAHLLAELYLSKDRLELGLVDTRDKPAGHVGVRLAEGRLQDLQVTR